MRSHLVAELLMCIANEDILPTLVIEHTCGDQIEVDIRNMPHILEHQNATKTGLQADLPFVDDLSSVIVSHLGLTEITGCVGQELPHWSNME